MEIIQSLKQLNIIHNPVALSIAIPIFLGMQKSANDLHVKTIFLGQGADELFGGYQKYVELYKNKELEETKKSMISDLRSLQNDQIIRERKMAHHFGLDLIYPFLDSKIGGGYSPRIPPLQVNQNRFTCFLRNHLSDNGKNIPQVRSLKQMTRSQDRLDA